MYDYVSTATRMNIEKPEQIPGRLAEVGRQMNALKQEKARHEISIAKQERMVEAYNTYTRIRPLIEGVQTPPQEMLYEYKNAYSILVQNQILTAEAYETLCQRLTYERQKCIDYDRRMPELKRQYHDLKKLEALAANPVGMLRRIYGYSLTAYDKAAGHDVDALIHNASSRTSQAGKSNEHVIEY